MGTITLNGIEIIPGRGLRSRADFDSVAALPANAKSVNVEPFQVYMTRAIGNSKPGRALIWATIRDELNEVVAVDIVDFDSRKRRPRELLDLPVTEGSGRVRDYKVDLATVRRVPWKSMQQGGLFLSTRQPVGKVDEDFIPHMLYHRVGALLEGAHDPIESSFDTEADFIYHGPAFQDLRMKRNQLGATAPEFDPGCQMKLSGVGNLSQAQVEAIAAYAKFHINQGQYRGERVYPTAQQGAETWQGNPLGSKKAPPSALPV